MLTYLNCRRSSEAKLGHVAGGHSLRDRPMRELAWDLKNKLTHTHTHARTHTRRSVCQSSSPGVFMLVTALTKTEVCYLLTTTLYPHLPL